MTEEEKLRNGFTEEEGMRIDAYERAIDALAPIAALTPEPEMCPEKLAIGIVLTQTKKIFDQAEARRKGHKSFPE